MIVNEDSLGFGMWIAQTEECEDVTLCSGKLVEAFFSFLDILQPSCLSINSENYCQFK